MYHSIDIETLPAKGSGSLTFNTYKDFYLVPTSLPVISAPGVKTKSVEIPGANGAIDLTESLTPYPLYKNRSGSLEFALLVDRYEYYLQHKIAPYNVTEKYGKDSKHMWTYIYSDIMNKIHGRKCKLYLEDDPEWYYEGRIALNQWKSSNDGKWPVITLNYDLAPYKLCRTTSLTYTTAATSDKWLWDPFSFMDGVIQYTRYTEDGNTITTGIIEYDPNNFGQPHLPQGFSADGLWKTITVNTDSYTTYGVIKGSSGNIKMDRDFTGWMPVCPTITVLANSTGMGIKITNPELGYTYTKEYDTNTSNKKYTDPECLLYDYLGDGYTLQLKGHGTFNISFRKGSL
jgi:hypothetical protein